MSGAHRLRVAVVLLALTPLFPALAGVREHEVAAGESASAIARRYYGDYDKAALLLRYNGREGATLHPGETLRVPYCDVHRVKPGDTGSALADRYLDRASAWPEVAELNGLAPERPLHPGQELVFPVVIEHRLQRGESLAKLGQRYWGDPGRAGLLQRFNELDDPRRLAVGERVLVPVVSFRLTPGAASPSSKAEPVARAPEPVPKYAKSLDEAGELWRAGEYERARELLEALREPVGRDGAPQERRALWRSLAFVYVAFDQPARACGAYGRLDEPPTLDPVTVSPKIRDVLSGCGSD